MEIVSLIIRLLLFGVFAISGVSKLLDPAGTEKAMREFGTPPEFSKFFSAALPFAEIVFAVCLLFVSMSWVGAAGALLLLLTFIGGMLWQIKLGRAPDCHCFGQIHSEPVGTKSLVRNIVLAVLAAVLLAQGRDGQGPELAPDNAGMLQIVLILFLVIVGIILLGYLVRLAAQQNELMRRLDVLEFASGDPADVERNDAGDPSDGLPIGAPLPDFSIPDINGRIVEFDHLLGEGKPLLFFFVGPQCIPCDSLLPELIEWEAALSPKVKCVFVSHGEVGPSREKFGGPASRTVLVEKKREFASSVKAKWTPTALFVDARGNIASHIAAGDVSMRKLVEQIKESDLNQRFTYFLGGQGRRRPNIGESVPEFSVTDVNGRVITEKDLSGRQTLVAFSSPSCSHCATLIEQFREWESIHNGDGPQIIVFSDGDTEVLRSHGLRAPVVLDEHHRTSNKLGMRGVPSAVLIDENGVIVTEAAIGGPNIWSLIGERRP